MGKRSVLAAYKYVSAAIFSAHFFLLEGSDKIVITSQIYRFMWNHFLFYTPQPSADPQEEIFLV